MPRTGPNYTLPSPPSPYAPNSPALAEDINASLDDIAAALTNSAPLDGSAPWTGGQNANGQDLGGVDQLTANTVTANTAVSSPMFRVTNAAGVYYAENGFNHGIAFGWDGSFIQGYVDGSYTGQLATVTWTQGQLGYDKGTSDGRYLYKSGDTCTGSLTVNGNVNISGNGVSWHGQAPIGIYWDNYKFIHAINTDASYNTVASFSGVNTWCVCTLTIDTSGIAIVKAGGDGSVVCTWPLSISDRRFKSNLRPAHDALTAVLATPVYAADYRWAAGAPTRALQFTLLADEVRKVAPGVVHEAPGPDKVLSLDPTHMCALLWRAVQELTARVAALEAPGGVV